jgi:hypothetical protein
MQRYCFVSLAFVIALLLSLVEPVSRPVVNAASVSANTGPLTCSNLDVVFIIDQSGSMSGYGGVPPTDPTEQRKYAPQAMVDLLSDIALDLCPAAHHRMALVSFGARPQIDLPLSDIAPDTFSDAQTLRETLKANIVATDLGQTDPQRAFEAAADILNDVVPIGDGIRKRAIIFITDGHPCVEELGCTPPDSTMDFVGYANRMRDWAAETLPFDPVLIGQEGCLSALRNQHGAENLPPDAVNSCLKEFPVDTATYQNSTYIFTLLLNFGEAYSRRLRDAYIEMSEAHAGHVVDLSENRSDIPTTFNLILSQLAGVQATRLACGKFAVNPYLAQMRIVFFKLSEDVVVRLTYTDVNGVRHVMERGQADETGGFDMKEYYEYGPNERYVFTDPYPGIWTLETDDPTCEGLDAFYDSLTINPGGYPSDLPPVAQSLGQHDRAPFYDINNPYYIEYQMRDQSSNIIPQADHERFHVDLQATVKDPKGSEGKYEFDWDAAGQLFRSTEPLQLPVSGTYTIDIVGTIYIHEGEPVITTEGFSEVFATPLELFRHEGVEFNVFPVMPVIVQITSPAAGEEITPIHGAINEGWPLPIKPIQVQAQIVNRDGTPLSDPLSDVLLKPDGALTATVKAGEAVSVPVTMTCDDTGNCMAVIEGFDTEGNQQVIVELRNEFSERYRPDGLVAEVQFRRADPLFSRTGFYYSLLALVIMAVLAIVVFNIIIRTNKVMGMLIFKDGTTTIAEFGLASGINWRNISFRELKNSPQLMLKKIRVENRNVSGSRRRSLIDDAVTSSVYGSDSSHPGIRVHCVASNGRAFSIDLDPDSPITYSDDTFAQMEFKPPNSSGY